MVEITFQEFARLAVVCGIAGILIGAGWAWIVSTPILQVTYAAPAANTPIAMRPVASVVPVHLTTSQGVVILFVLIIIGAVLGIAARKVQEWNVRRIGGVEK